MEFMFDNLILAQIVEKFLTFYGTQSLIIVFRVARHRTVAYTGVI
jgi:hypothetical protein